MNVLRLLILIISLLPISGCLSFSSLLKTEKEEVKEVEVKTKQVERTRLNLEHPEPLNFKDRNIKWMIVTQDNVMEVFEEMSRNGVDPVFFALTDDGYKELSLTIADVRNYIAQQRSIILKYKNYYEPEVKDGTNGKSEGSTN